RPRPEITGNAMRDMIYFIRYNTMAGSIGSGSPQKLIASTAAAAVLLSMFIRRERRTPGPLVDLDLFRITPFAGGTLAIVLSYAMLYGMFFLIRLPWCVGITLCSWRRDCGSRSSSWR